MRRGVNAILIAVIALVSLVLAGVILGIIAHSIFPLRYEEYIEQYSAEYGLDKYEVMGVIHTESKFAPLARSNSSKGLMQIANDTAQGIAKELGLAYSPDMTYDVETNIRMGCFYLAYLKELYPKEDTYIAAYNAGPGTIRGWLEDEANTMDGEVLYYIPYPETRDYVAKVARTKKIYGFLYK